MWVRFVTSLASTTPKLNIHSTLGFWVLSVYLIFLLSNYCSMHTIFIIEIILQELREIGGNEAVKGKYFFLETDVKGPSLKLDNTGKAILTVSVSLSANQSV